MNTYTLFEVNQGYVALRMRISREGKDHWFKAKATETHLQGEEFQVLGYVTDYL